MALGRTGASTGIALLDVSTGEFWVGRTAPARTPCWLPPCCAARPRPSCRRRYATASDLLARLQAAGATLTFADPGPLERPARRDGALQPLQCDDARGLRSGRPRGRPAGGGCGAGLCAGHAGRSARPPGAPAAPAPRRLHDARRDRRAHARAAGGQRRHRAEFALRRARRDGHADGRAPAAPVAAAAAARSRSRSPPARTRSPRWSTRPRLAPGCAGCSSRSAISRA